ncbi:hypothetical protein [Xenorhabdus hominickii]|uniref:Uncharacterized protein n=1 Tax=Xenorhabdus hominickii TaxID=351679 RepID=A0A2G0Q237_XENHO|nr:hypothetical protein [Xenorhabdus hominickii]AOM40217.1 hypothetical protein A9255_06265 [Xenorhabdus hominickii]PHM53277.1 hypothetical protein Xhom_04172 [Xenorhabdus hominickii]
MNNNVIKRINVELESAEKLKSAGANEITLNLDIFITILKRLANYENMKPVAIYNLADGKVYKSIHDIGDGKSVFAVELYPHPNK